MRHPLEIDVPDPNEFWFATFADGFIGVDPDVEDGYERTYVEGGANWKHIAEVMTDLSEQLRAARTDLAAITFDLPESTPDYHVISAWFRTGEAVLGDPGHLENGRHRLWRTWRAHPDAVLPVRSAIRSVVPVVGEPTVRDVEMVLSNAREALWERNPNQRAWFAARRGGLATVEM